MKKTVTTPDAYARMAIQDFEGAIDVRWGASDRIAVEFSPSLLLILAPEVVKDLYDRIGECLAKSGVRK